SGRLANRRERFHFQRSAADERTVDVTLREELDNVVGLDRTAVEHRHVEEAFDQRMCFLRLLWGCRLARADRPDRLVGDDQVVVMREDRNLAAKDVLRLAARFRSSRIT